MKRRRRLPAAAIAALSLGLTPHVPATATATAADSTQSWHRVFTDAFNGAALSSVWTPRGTTYTTGMTHARSDLRACRVVDGTLHVRTIADPNNAGKYLDCHIGTQASKSWTYGRFSVYARMQPWAGSHSSFWLQSNPGYVPNASEVDIVERMGSTNPTSSSGTTIGSNVYWDWSGSNGGSMKSHRVSVNDVQTLSAGQRWWNSYHVFSVGWWPHGYYFRVDGRLTTVIRDGVSSRPEFMVLSMLTRDYEVALHAGHPLNSYQMLVKWVTVDQWK